MALYEYQYDISTSFTSLSDISDLNITILQQEIDDDTIIVSEVHHILANIDDDNCIIYFQTELTTTEEDQLNVVIANHTGLLSGGVNPSDIAEGGVADISFVYGDQYDDYYIYFKHTTYKVGTQFIFRGTNILGVPKGVKAILQGEGKLRLYDLTNNHVLFEWEDINENDWSIFSYKDINWPSGEAILELQGRESYNSNKNLFCSNFMICFAGEVTNNLPSGYAS